MRKSLGYTYADRRGCMPCAALVATPEATTVAVPRVVAIGASSGGIEALQTIVAALRLCSRHCYRRSHVARRARVSSVDFGARRTASCRKCAA